MELLTPTNILTTAIFLAITIIGYFLQDKLSGLVKTDDRLENKLDKVSVKMDKIESRMSDIQPKIDILWKDRIATAYSPMQLNERGKEILEKSGVKELIDNALPQLIEEIKENNPQNAYQVQEIAAQIVLKLKNNSEILTKLQIGAYNTGVDVDSVLFAGALYLRDLALPKFNFKLEDIA